MGSFRVLLIFALACGVLACAAAAEQPAGAEQVAEQPASESAVATAAAAASSESADAAEEAAGGPEEEEDDFDAAVETLTTLASIAARAAKGAHANLKHNNKHKKHHGHAVRVHPGRKWGAPKYGKSKEADGAKKQQHQHGPDHGNGSPSGSAHGKKHAPVADGKPAKLQQHKDKDSKDHSSAGHYSGAHAHGKHAGSPLGKHSHKPEAPKAPVFDIEGGEYDSTEREGVPFTKSKEEYSSAEDASEPEPAEASSSAEAKQARVAGAPEAAADDNEGDAAANKVLTDDAANTKEDATQQQPKEPEQPVAEGLASAATQPPNEEVKTATHEVAAEEAAEDEELKSVKAMLQSGWLTGLQTNQPAPASGDEAPAAAAATLDSDRQQQPEAAAAVPDSDKQQQPAATAAAAPDHGHAQEEPKASFGSQPTAAPSEASGPKVLAAGECPAGTAPATIATSHPELGITVAALTITDATAADDVGLRAYGGCGKLVQVGGGCDLDCHGERFGYINYMKVHTNSVMSWFNQPTQAVRCSAALFAALDKESYCTLTPVVVCCVPEGAAVEQASARVAKRLGLT